MTAKLTYQDLSQIDGTQVAVMYIKFLSDQIKAYPSMKRRGHFYYAGTLQAVAAFDGKKCVSAIAYSFGDGMDAGAFISMSYTDPDYRKQGLHDKLFKRLCKKLKKEGCRYIDSMTALENHTMRKIMEKQGRMEVATYHTIMLD